jgi:hypothetical protein
LSEPKKQQLELEQIEANQVGELQVSYLTLTYLPLGSRAGVFSHGYDTAVIITEVMVHRFVLWGKA